MTFEYTYKTPPRKQQQELLPKIARLPYFAIFWEMRIGKSKLMIDNAAYLYQQKEINGVLIIAPNGVDLNWVLDEIPKHCPDSVMKESRVFRFSTKKSKTKVHKAAAKWHREHHGLAWLVMSYDAILTDAGKEVALTFLDRRRVFYILDESVSIKTPGAKRTMRITRTSYRAPYRRILDGYPSPQGSFDLYSQFLFLNNDFWKQHQLNDYGMFKHYFGVFESKRNYKAGVDYEEFQGYQRLDELNKIIDPHMSRLLQKDVLDVQPKNYEFRYFELTSPQRKLYDELEEEYMVWLDSGELVTAKLAMVRELRLQQISCGYLPVGEGEPVHMIEGENSRLEALEALIENNTEKGIIWARYKLDISLISELLSMLGHKFVTYTGDTNDEDRVKAKTEFQKGDAQWLVGTPSAAGIGLTLDAARNLIYYSNSFNLRHRRQSEERATADGQKYAINIFDIVGLGTRDKSIIENLCDKMDITDSIFKHTKSNDLRDALRKWKDESCGLLL
jgi:SNF2 family DNA or RNA helicase